MAANGLEIERKYLLSGAPSEAELAALGARATRIEQVYLRMTDGWIRRVRRVEANGVSRHVLTLKQDVEGIVRREIETNLPPEEYDRLVAEADPARGAIRKVRHVIPFGRWTLELDVFSEPPGLVLLEVELDAADDVPDLPPAVAAYVVREVSAEPAYANYSLALRAGTGAGVAAVHTDVAAGLTAGREGGTVVSMAHERRDDDRPDDLPPTEAARARRRDHDASAAERKGMRTGLAKQFKQVLDAQVKRAREAGKPRATRLPRAASDEAEDEAEGPERHAPKKPWRRRGEP